jgi:hypothetical protein
MDVEGSEVATVRGMGPTLRRSRLPPMVYESNGFTLGLFGHRPADLLSEIAEYGFRNYLVDGRTLRPLAEPWFQPSGLVDCVASPDVPRNMRLHKLGRRLSRAETTRRFLESVRSPNPAIRLYAVGALARAPEDILRHPRVVAAARALPEDADGRVRAAARELELPRRRSGARDRFLDRWFSI